MLTAQQGFRTQLVAAQAINLPTSQRLLHRVPGWDFQQFSFGDDQFLPAIASTDIIMQAVALLDPCDDHAKTIFADDRLTGLTHQPSQGCGVAGINPGGVTGVVMNGQAPAFLLHDHTQSQLRFCVAKPALAGDKIPG